MTDRSRRHATRSITLVVRGPGGPPTMTEIAELLSANPTTTGKGEGDALGLRVYNVEYPETEISALCRDCDPVGGVTRAKTPVA
jgi:hypothetical protein